MVGALVVVVADSFLVVVVVTFEVEEAFPVVGRAVIWFAVPVLEGSREGLEEAEVESPASPEAVVDVSEDEPSTWVGSVWAGSD